MSTTKRQTDKSKIIAGELNTSFSVIYRISREKMSLRDRRFQQINFKASTNKWYLKNTTPNTFRIGTFLKCKKNNFQGITCESHKKISRNF